MKSDKRLMAEIADLVIFCLNGTIDQQQLNHLENLLENNPLAVKYYVEIMTVHTGLNTIDGMASLISSGDNNINKELWNNLLQQESTLPSIALEEDEPEEKIQATPIKIEKRTSKFGKLSLIAALISIASLISFAVIGQKSLKPLVPHAVITSCYKVEWHNPLFDYKVGDKIADNLVNITSGLLKLEMNDGTGVVLQGPCSFSLESDSQINLAKGKLTAKVPNKAIGFTVRTPSASVVDYGTEFGVIVDKYANTEAHVSKGEVELRLGSDKYNFNKSLRLLKNQAGQTSGTSLKPIPASINIFAYDTPSKFETTVKSLSGTNLYIKSLNDNPESLSDIMLNPRIELIKNENLEIVPGPKFNSKTDSNAILFSGSDPKLTINNLLSVPQDEDGSYSVGFWMKLNKTGEQIICAGEIAGAMVHHRAFIVTDEGKLQHCALGIKNGKRWKIAKSKLSLDIDTWYFVMVVRDVQNDTKKLYVNSKLVANSIGNPNGTKIPRYKSISFGGDIANIKGFEGALGEIMMFSKALSKKDIEELYKSAF